MALLVLKVHIYPDEIAAIAISKIMERPVKFVADRLESYSSDIHSRCHKIKGKIGVDENGNYYCF